MNNATEQMLGVKLNEQQSRFAAMASLRNAWLAAPGDIIISTRPIGSDFQNYICRTLGYPPNSLTVIDTQQMSGDATVLTDDLLLSDALVRTVRSRIAEGGMWSMLACYQSEGTARLQSLLGLDNSVGRRFAEARGTDLLNRKSHFRQFASGVGLPLADGAVVSSPEALSRAVETFIMSTGVAIIKRDNGAGGTGNIVLTRTESAPRAGACETIVADTELSALAVSLWQRMTSGKNNVLVVESYYSADRAFYLEFYIAPDGTIEFLNSGTIRSRYHDDPHAKQLFWVGLELPADLTPTSYARSVSLATRFVELAAQMGYRGHINIDAIITDTGELLFNEANGRWGGGTVVHSVAQTLLGPTSAETHVVSSYRDVPAPDLATTLATLENHRLLFDRLTNEGVVVLACDDTFSHTIEALVVARTRERLRLLEGQLCDALRPVAEVAV